LAVDQRVAQVPWLRHAHHGLVDGGVTMWVVLADHFTDDARALGVLARRVEPHLLHGVEDAPLHWLETVPHIRQSAVDDHRHGVVDEDLRDLVRDLYLDDLPFVHQSLLRRARVTPSEPPQRTRPDSRYYHPGRGSRRFDRPSCGPSPRGSLATMVERCSTPEMRELWSEAERYRAWLRGERAATEAFAALGDVPVGSAAAGSQALA